MPARDVVIVVPHMGEGGAQRITALLCREWARRGHALTLVSIFEEEDLHPLPSSVERVRLAAPSTMRWLGIGRLDFSLDLGIGWGLAASLRRRVRTLLHMDRRSGLLTFPWLSFGLRILALRRALEATEAPRVLALCGSTSIMTIIAAAGLGRRVVISERNDPARQRLEYPWHELRPHLYPRADVVTANTRGALSTMARYTPGAKLRFVPNPLAELPPSEPDEVLAALDGAPFMLMIGRLHRQKAYDVALHALALVAAERTPWPLFVAGTGQEADALATLAEELGVARHVRWLGFREPRAYYERATIFLLPSRHEGTPNALLEALSFGLPSIISDASPGPLDVVRDEVDALVVPKEDPAALARAIVRLMDDDALRERLGVAARSAVTPYALENAMRVWDEVLAW